MAVWSFCSPRRKKTAPKGNVFRLNTPDLTSAVVGKSLGEKPGIGFSLSSAVEKWHSAKYVSPAVGAHDPF
jgi:hypothetical protein